jgi:glycine cleavage system regulatory protein
VATIVLTALGDDRPGLVEALSGIVARHGGSWQRSHMARLAGKFAGIVEVVVPDRERDGILAALEPLRGEGLLEVTVEIAREAGALDAVQLVLDLVGSDRPGIVHEVAATLAAHDVSIVELETATTSAPMAGEALFTARAVLAAPARLPPDDLRRALEALANELMVDLDLTAPG